MAGTVSSQKGVGDVIPAEQLFHLTARIHNKRVGKSGLFLVLSTVKLFCALRLKSYIFIQGMFGIP